MSAQTTLSDQFQFYFNIAMKYSDSTIAIILVILLFLDTILIQHSPNSFIFIYPLLLVIFAFDVCFKNPILSSSLQLNRIFNSTSKTMVENFFKALSYMIILGLIILMPPEVPLTFLIPNFASIDYYFLLTVFLITGLYYSLFNVFKLVFTRKKESIDEF